MNINALKVALDFADASKEYLDLKAISSEKRAAYISVRDEWKKQFGGDLSWDEIVSDSRFLFATRKSYSEYQAAKRKHNNAAGKMRRRYKKLNEN